MPDGSVHNLIIENRRRTSVSGVTDVESFDDKTLCVYTAEGQITFRGDNLRVSVLNLEVGEVAFEGRVDNVSYKTGAFRKDEPLLKRLFR